MLGRFYLADASKSTDSFTLSEDKPGPSNFTLPGDICKKCKDARYNALYVYRPVRDPLGTFTERLRDGRI